MKAMASAIEVRALQILAEYPHTCTQIGERLWPLRRHATRQSFVRPAGKIIKRLVSRGLVRQASRLRDDEAAIKYTVISRG